MAVSKNAFLVAALVLVAGCAGRQMTGEDHRQAAAADLTKAEQERAQFNPDQKAMAITPRNNVDNPISPPVFYNPSAAHLIEADRKMASAFAHLETARKLEKYEDLCKTLGEGPADVGLAWLLNNPVVTAPIIGPRTIEQFTGSLRALEIKLSAETLKQLDEIWPGPGGAAPEAYAW